MKNLIENVVHFRYKPKRQAFRNEGPCPAFRLFDWVIWYPDSLRQSRIWSARPKTVLCLARRGSLLILRANAWRLKNVNLVVAGEDTKLSQLVHLLDPLLDRCRSVHFEAKDIEHDGIRSFSMGLISYYLSRAGRDFVQEVVEKTDQPGWRKAGVLAAWGAVWGGLDAREHDRRTAAEFVENSTWINREFLEPRDYWRRLAESEFVVAPQGQGVQAPKLAEAWLTKTVPIVTKSPCFTDLLAAGYPMVVLQRWDELTPGKLLEWKASQGTPDWDEVRRKLTLGYLAELIA